MKRGTNHQHFTRHRIWLCLALTIAALGVLGCKLYVIQVMDQARYASVADRQQRVVLSGVDGRGLIYDRNMNPLTDSTDDYIYLIDKKKLDSEGKRLLSRAGAKPLRNSSDKYAVYSAGEYHGGLTEQLKERYGAFVMKTARRYADPQPAVHLVGYVNQADGEGECGLEKDFDSLLSDGNKTVYAVGDSTGRILPGLGIKTSGENLNCGVITTLDQRVQRKAEALLRELERNGAIVVSEAASGAILASASTPVYDPQHVEDYLNSGGQELINKVTQAQYPPGSIFKIVVAAAALESGKVQPDTEFFCPGYWETDGVKIGCAAGGEKGHGTIAFADGFAQSCNAVFIQTGQRVGGEAITEMSRRFGLGEAVLPGLSEERPGVVPEAADFQGAGIGNLSIGQGKLLVTPLQANRMTKIIAAGGVDTGLYLIKGTMENGRIRQVDHQSAKRVISEETAETVSRLMRWTVKSGSANNITSDSAIHAAGKTGSAEAFLNGEPVVHAWFTGFFPVEAPRYVITVFVENGRSGRAAAVPVFEKMALFLNEQELHP